MNKSLIIRNGGIFLISIIAIIFSIGILGKDNLMVGANAIFLLVGILNKDFTNRPVKSLIKVTFLMIFIGSLGYLVNLNIYSGIFINFIGIFILLYLIVYRINKTIYYPFLFGYTLLLTSNVYGIHLAFRIGGLAVVGIVSVMFQIFYLKTCEKEEMFAFKRSIKYLYKFMKTNDIKDSESFYEINNFWSREIFENRSASFYLNHKENIELNIISMLDKIGRLNKELNLSNIDIKDNLHKDFIEIVKSIDKYIHKNLKEEELKHIIRDFSIKYEKFNDNIFIFEIIESINTLESLSVNLFKLEIKEFKVNKKLKKLDIKEWLLIMKDDFNINSVRFIFSFRTALLISLTYFTIEYYHIWLGKWIIFTIASVSQPYNNTVNNRAKDRVIGTLVGAISYYLLSFILIYSYERVIIIFIAIYLYIHFRRYVENVAMITIMFLGLATLDVVNTTHATEARIFFIFVGCLIVLLGNRYIFPYDFKRETQVLIRKYMKYCNNAFLGIVIIYKDKNAVDYVKNNILHARSLENKIIMNNRINYDENIEKFIIEERKLINCIQNIFNRIEVSDITLRLNGKYRMDRVNSMIKEILNEDELKKEIMFEKYTKEVCKINEKLIYKDAVDMALAKKNINEIENLFSIF